MASTKQTKKRSESDKKKLKYNIVKQPSRFGMVAKAVIHDLPKLSVRLNSQLQLPSYKGKYFTVYVCQKSQKK